MRPDTVVASFIDPRAELHLPGAPFLLAALMLAVSAVIAWRATRPAPAPADIEIGARP